jgi:hypothetical protein
MTITYIKSFALKPTAKAKFHVRFRKPSPRMLTRTHKSAAFHFATLRINKTSRNANANIKYAKTVSSCPNDNFVASEIENPLIKDAPNREVQININAVAILDSGAA